MGKLLILSITDGEEQLLDKLKDFLAEAPGIEIVEQPHPHGTPQRLEVRAASIT